MYIKFREGKNCNFYELHFLIAVFMDKDKKNENFWPMASLAWELGYLIAVPLVVFALAGKFLDKKLGSSPWLLLGGIFFSLAVSSYMVYKKIIPAIK